MRNSNFESYQRATSNKAAQNVVTIDSASKCCTLECPAAAGPGNGKVYQFDAAFGPEATTEFVYENVGSVIVEAVLDGYNGTVFAYGQTGCGKSHTMRGFIERTLDHIFEATSTASAQMRYLALLSYLERGSQSWNLRGWRFERGDGERCGGMCTTGRTR